MKSWPNRFLLLQHFLAYYWRSSTVYDIHTPFVYKFAQEVVEDKRMFYPYQIIESTRQQLLNDDKPISIVDYGAGSKADQRQTRPLKNIVKHSAIATSAGRQLFRLVNWHKPQTILELGTSTGISTMYLNAGALNAKLITVEGCPQTATIAQQNFSRLGLNRIQVINLPFSEALDQLLPQQPTFDFVFLDGDHQLGHSLNYFERLQPHLHEESIFIIADMYWSHEMQQTWQAIKQHPKTTLSIDLFHIGIIYRHSIFQEVQHFSLVPARWKPWHLGIFPPK